MSNQQRKRYNLQIIDFEGRTSLLLKSILLGSDCRVSISSKRSSACAKLETGLFDGAIVDLVDKKQVEQIGSMIKDHVPSERSFPVGSITDHPDVRLSSSELTIERPIRIHRFQRLVRRMKKRMDDRNHTQQLDPSIQCRIRLAEANRTLPVSRVTLNNRGLMARLEQQTGTSSTVDQITDEDVSFLVSLPDSNVEKELSADAAFEERGTNDTLTGIGLRFQSRKDKVSETIRTLEEQGAFQSH